MCKCISRSTVFTRCHIPCVSVCMSIAITSVFHVQLYFEFNCIHTTVCVCIHCTVSMYPLQLRVWPRASVKPLLCLDGSSCLSPPCHPPPAACNTWLLLIIYFNYIFINNILYILYAHQTPLLIIGKIQAEHTNWQNFCWVISKQSSCPIPQSRK